MTSNDSFFLLARSIDEHEIWFKPASWLKLWIWIIKTVNWRDTKTLKRGQGLFIWSYVKIKNPDINEHIWHNFIKWAKSATQITTQKTTRGMIITVLNYNKYQYSKDYKNNTESNTQNEIKTTQQRHSNDTISQTVKQLNIETGSRELTPKEKTIKFFTDTESQEQVINKLILKGIDQNLSRREVLKFIRHWTELNGAGTKQRWQMQETFEINKRLVTWFNNIKNFNSPFKKAERTVEKI